MKIVSGNTVRWRVAGQWAEQWVGVAGSRCAGGSRAANWEEAEYRERGDRGGCAQLNITAGMQDIDMQVQVRHIFSLWAVLEKFPFFSS